MQTRVINVSITGSLADVLSGAVKPQNAPIPGGVVGIRILPLMSPPPPSFDNRYGVTEVPTNSVNQISNQGLFFLLQSNQDNLQVLIENNAPRRLPSSKQGGEPQKLGWNLAVFTNMTPSGVDGDGSGDEAEILFSQNGLGQIPKYVQLQQIYYELYETEQELSEALGAGAGGVLDNAHRAVVAPARSWRTLARVAGADAINALGTFGLDCSDCLNSVQFWFESGPEITGTSFNLLFLSPGVLGIGNTVVANVDAFAPGHAGLFISIALGNPNFLSITPPPLVLGVSPPPFLGWEYLPPGGTTDTVVVMTVIGR